VDGVVDSLKNVWVIFIIDRTINQKLEARANEQQINLTKKSNKEKKKE
jgi:hypothetical protein